MQKSLLAHCPVQCCPAPAHKIGLMADEPPRIVFIGCTGSGKSSLCTAITGQDKSKEARAASTFKIGKGAKSETTTCKVEEHKWLGDEKESPFMCIDTPGLNDSEGDDEHHINEIIASMKKLDYVNCIVLVLNGTDPRFSKSLQDAISNFEEAFGGEQVGGGFFDNLVICFQRWKMHQDAVNEREQDEITQDTVAADFREQFAAKFAHCRAAALPCIFVDSHDSEPARKADTLLALKRSIPSNVFRTGNLEQIKPRLAGFHPAEQRIFKGVEILPMMPRLVDDKVRIMTWHVDPPLPPGLRISERNGRINGAPHAAGPAVTHLIVAESQGGRSQPVALKIEPLMPEDEIKELVEDYRQKTSASLTVEGVYLLGRKEGGRGSNRTECNPDMSDNGRPGLERNHKPGDTRRGDASDAADGWPDQRKRNARSA